MASSLELREQAGYIDANDVLSKRRHSPCKSGADHTFFRMSRSLVTRLSPAFRRRTSALWSSSAFRTTSDLPNFAFQVYRLWVVMPRRRATFPTE